MIRFDLQVFASKKGVGSTKNGRDSRPKYRGAKISDGQYANAGQIIYRQKGNLIYPGFNVGQGNDFTLFALRSGIVRYEKFGKNKKRVRVLEQQES